MRYTIVVPTTEIDQLNKMIVIYDFIIKHHSFIVSKYLQHILISF